MIYFDNAASSYPKPDIVYSSVFNWMKNNGANPGRSGHDMSVAASEMIFETRCLIASLFGVEHPENIAFVPGATYGLNAIIQGVLLPGDHVIMTDLEHNSVLRPIYKLSNKGVDYTVVNTDLYDDSQTIKNILSCIRKNTKMVICTQCSNVCGKVMPIESISKMLPRKIKLVVDGSQGAGVIDTDIVKSGIDYYCAPSHKGLYGPQGSGFVVVNSELPTPIITGGTGSDSFSKTQPDYMPDLLESGTLATPVICGMYNGLKYIKNKKIFEIYKHKKNLTDYFYINIYRNNKIIKYIDYEKSNFVGTACFNFENRHSEETADYLNKHGIYVRAGTHCSPLFHKKMGTESQGMVRVSFGMFNTYSQIDYLIKILNKY